MIQSEYDAPTKLRIAEVRTQLIAALVEQGADGLYAIGFVEKHVHIGKAFPGEGLYLQESTGRVGGVEPQSLREFAGILQSQHPALPLSSPLRSTVPPAGPVAAPARVYEQMGRF